MRILLYVLQRTVRLIGLEPTRITTPDPKSGASTNFATSAIAGAKVILLFDLQSMIGNLFSSAALFLTIHTLSAQYLAGSLDDGIYAAGTVVVGHVDTDVGGDAKLGVLHIYIKGGTGREAYAPAIGELR